MTGQKGGAAQQQFFQGEITRRGSKEGGHRAKMKGARTTSECWRRMSIGEEWEGTGWRGWQEQDKRVEPD